MWCSKVLVAYDGSTPSAKALDLAQSIGAQDERIELVFAHVLKLFALGTGAEGPLIEEANRVHAALQQLAERVPNKAHAHLLKGTSPADLLLKCAEDEGCDLIVMGSRGKGGVKGYLGSVSYAVVQGSPVAVLIAKDAPGAGAVSASTTPAAETPRTGPQGANPSGTSADQAAR
ncbi:MAG: universal stress protein [Gordonibacter pamelaeae]|jgi:nucleotide-binding universal stress UspA family protein|uniref:Universal stress protein UspA and related nucleotide-binding proteins n=2 Tax=Gordonibacter pamelaeae TaxID=471189 RepID=D6E8S5_9ACTN|nr:universal stress protein [Gordonibacter pamelaeae]HJH73110.1 universal stress protein [Eggerthellaceae bacterium]MBS4896226.1 universal stress protein [Gordonibacter pamelaeae]MCB6311197.1 universal stress protein [Gordonibacter pamelaeae]RDB64240.1 universal stress protein [Gordonibacter pamelaeae]CBL04122.1 Universal stress protein UspA and related nucleotide-binding proteins [Gordonibacter pamelaeae 7-10-1-b]